MPEFELDPKQIHMAEHTLERKASWNKSKPGTGKTLASIHAFALGRQRGLISPEQKMLVFAPKSILQAAWGDDIDKYNEGMGTNLTYSIATAGKKRLELLTAPVDIIITNHDASKFCSEHFAELQKAGFVWINIDEATAYKTPTSQRTKAMFHVRALGEWVTVMSGNPNAKTVQDLWAPTFIADGGEHLGKSFFKFRNQVAEPIRVGQDPNAVNWVDKDGAEEEIAQALADMTVRYELELSVKNDVLTYYTDLPKKVRAAYDQMNDMSLWIDDEGELITAVHAGVKANKMLQILTGAVYDQNGEAHYIDTERYEQVIEHVKARDHSLVAFNYNHEIEQLEKHAKKEKLKYGVIKGGVPDWKRTQIMHDFQDGKLDVVFAHPKSAAHGLTFTRGTAVIWCSPCNSPEYFQQFNARVHRKGQTRDNQIIRIAARGTKEADVYEGLDNDLTRAEDLLAILSGVTQQEALRYANDTADSC